MISLRYATERDKQDLWQWRNDAQTRTMSLSTHEVSWAEHCDWFEKVFDDGARHLLIGDNMGIACGSVRLDQTGVNAEINITVAPEHRGLGVGLALLKAAAVQAQLIGLKKLTAVIRPANKASKVIFERAGYTACGQGETTEHFEFDLGAL
jgi:UDP-2,4-diacetamido-2,4,6-trideoxy-beta-L-altropyranose hydrolase